MKRIGWILAALVVISGCTAKDPAKPAKGKIKEVHAAEVLKQLDQKQSMLLVIGTSTCGSCIEFDDVLKEYIQDHKITFASLKTDDEPIIKNTEGQEVRQDYLDLQARIGKITVTPTIVMIVNGEVKAMESGGWNKQELKELLKTFDEAKNTKPLTGRITYKNSTEVMQAIQKKESMILIVGRTTCSACIHFQKTIHSFLETEAYTFTELMTDKETAVKDENGKTVLPEFEKLEAIIGQLEYTPTMFRIENGVVVNTSVGSISETELKEFLDGYPS